MAQRSDRLVEATKLLGSNTPYTDYCYKQLRTSRDWSLGNIVQHYSNVLALVTQTNQHSFRDDLESKTCTCGHFQENSIPCSHAFAFILNLQNHHAHTPQPSHYISQHLRTTTWQATYKTNILLILANNLPISQEVQPPSQSRNKRGCSKIKQFLPGSTRNITQAQRRLTGIAAPTEYGQGSQACQQCKEYGHNHRTCKVGNQLELFEPVAKDMDNVGNGSEEDSEGESGGESEGSRVDI